MLVNDTNIHAPRWLYEKNRGCVSGASELFFFLANND